MANGTPTMQRQQQQLLLHCKHIRTLIRYSSNMHSSRLGCNSSNNSKRPTTQHCSKSGNTTFSAKGSSGSSISPGSVMQRRLTLPLVTVKTMLQRILQQLVKT